MKVNSIGVTNVVSTTTKKDALYQEGRQTNDVNDDRVKKTTTLSVPLIPEFGITLISDVNPEDTAVENTENTLNDDMGHNKKSKQNVITLETTTVQRMAIENDVDVVTISEVTEK